MIKLETTTKNGDKVLAYTITKALSIPVEELIKYAKELNISIKSPQSVISLNEAYKLIDYIQKEKSKLYFNPNDWKTYSTLDDYQNLIKFIDKVLLIIDSQIEENSDILKNADSIYIELQVLESQSDYLLEIKDYLLSKFDFSLERLKDKLIFMKSEAIEYLEKVDKSISIYDDEKLSNQKINFSFTATKIVRFYEEQMNKINNFAKFNSFFSKLLGLIKKLKELDDKFYTTNKEKLKDILKDSYLEEYYEKIFKEWEEEINKINRFYMKFIKAYFVGKISENILLESFEILNKIKQDLEEFYLTIRSGLITKYKDNPKNDLIQKVVVRDRIFKIYQEAQKKFLELLKKEDSKVVYRFINEILKELLNFHIEIEGYEEIYEKIIKLHSKNLEMYLNDIIVYGRELEKRDLEISKLIFKMQKDLERK